MIMDQMQIRKEYPPNIEAIRARFGPLSKNLLFAYGTTLYNPDDAEVPMPTRIHELTHFAQQSESTPETWWERYLANDQFRLDQEVEAMSNEFNSVRENVADRNRAAWYLSQLAKGLSSPTYGSMVGYSEALRLIRKHADTGYIKKRKR